MDDDEEEQFISPFRSLLHRAISLLWHEEQKIEQEMLDTAIQNSLETYHDSLFIEDDQWQITIGPSILEKDVGDECHLCLEYLKKGDRVILLPCQHVFHSPCINELITHQHVLCPLCRRSIPIEKKETTKPSASINDGTIPE